MRNFLVAALLLLAAGSTIAAAQENASQNEVAGTIGRTFISDQGTSANIFDNTVHFGKGLSFEAAYARTLRRYFWGDLAVEIPVIFNADEDLNYGTDQTPEQYSSTFITPSARVTLIPNLAISPWFSFGGGLGHFVASKDLQYYNTNPGPRIKTTSALQGAVGMDVRIPNLKKTRFRVEARDDWSGVPQINVNTGKTRQHNYYVGGGLVFHF
jgi:opacity protein-like surface antigen